MAYAAAAVVFLASFVAWTRMSWGGLLATRTFVDVSSTIIPAAVAGLSLWRAHYLPRERRLAWQLIGAGSLAWALGNSMWTYLELWTQRDIPIELRTVPFPSLADAGYILLIPAAGAALLGMVVGGTAVTSRVRTLLDGFLIAGAILFIGWATVLRPLASYAGQQATTLAKVLSLAYPLGDLILVSLLLLVATRVQPSVQRTLAWLGAALAALTFADVGFWYQLAHNSYASGSWSDVGWPACFLCIGYAAIRPIPIVAASEAPRPGLALTVLPLGPFVVATVAGIIVELREGWLEPFLFWNAIVVIGLLTTRQFVMLLENLQLRQQVERSLAEVKAAQAARTQMLTNITHDLASPLTPVRLQVRLLETAGGPLSEPQAKSLGIIRRNVEHVVAMVGDLKDMANLDAGRLRLDVQSADAAVLVRQATESMRAQGVERSIVLVVDAPGALPLTCDPVRINQVLTNLIGNSLKFTPAGGRITVSTQADGTFVRFDVADTGRGITAADQAKLFRAFSQVHDRQAMAPNERGTGLGLYICKGIAEQHGGTIAVASAGAGQGSTFTVRLPIVKA